MEEKVKTQGFGFAKYPFIRLYKYSQDKKTGEKKFGPYKQLLFGDYIKLGNSNNEPDTIVEKGKTYVKVRSRADGYILPEDIQADRILEVNFIDVGQGDGCHVVTPEDNHFIIDAGMGDNMYRFLKWRFNLEKSNTKPPSFTAVISHSDSDHYKGYGKIFSPGKETKQQLIFDKIYHNGLVERSGDSLDSLGTLTDDKKFITDLCDTDEQFTKMTETQKEQGVYISTLIKSNAPKESLRFGHAPIYKAEELKMEVIGPYPSVSNGKPALPVFGGNKGKTKNGNSIILRLTMGRIRILLGGDLNALSEDYLLGCFSGEDVAGIKAKLSKKGLSELQRKEYQKLLDSAIEKSKPFLEVEIAKSCHHGSPDFTTEFLRALNPVATIISSGDEESYCHPRPETLGTIGKFARGERPLIFSTELARSSKEYIDLTKIPPAKKKERTVTVYGMINLRSDGKRVVIAQKLEKKAPGRDWDIHCLEWNEKESCLQLTKSTE